MEYYVGKLPRSLIAFRISETALFTLDRRGYRGQYYFNFLETYPFTMENVDTPRKKARPWSEGDHCNAKVIINHM